MISKFIPDCQVYYRLSYLLPIVIFITDCQLFSLFSNLYPRTHLFSTIRPICQCYTRMLSLSIYSVKQTNKQTNKLLHI